MAPGLKVNPVGLVEVEDDVIRLGRAIVNRMKKENEEEVKVQTKSDSG